MQLAEGAKVFSVNIPVLGFMSFDFPSLILKAIQILVGAGALWYTYNRGRESAARRRIAESLERVQEKQEKTFDVPIKPAPRAKRQLPFRAGSDIIGPS